MSDLDQEELIATRELKGLDNNLYDAVEILRNAIKCNKKQFEELGTHILLQDEEQEAIEIVLGNLDALCDMQRTADKKINELDKKLEKEKKLTRLAQTLTDESIKESLVEFEKDYISKQKIKDKIEELKYRADRIAGTYQYADSQEHLQEKKNKVIELRTKAATLEELLKEVNK